MRNHFSKLAYVAAFGLALTFTFSCSSDDGGGGGNVLPSSSSSEQEMSSSSNDTALSSSSSSLTASTVLCLYSGGCIAIATETCTILSGQAVQSCPEASSSSGGVSPPPTSSSSSSEQEMSSSSNGTAPSSSSFSSSASTVLCLYNGGCIAIAPETCALIGQAVQSCPAASSSSGVSPPPTSSSSSSETAVPSSSSAVPSSSSLELSSSSAVPSSSSVAVILSSSSVVPSSSSTCSGAVNYCNYGDCAEWSSDGWACLRRNIDNLSGGGCYPMPTNDNCSSGTVVSACPLNAIPPKSNYCELPLSKCDDFVDGTPRTHKGKDKAQFCDSRDGKKYVYVTIGSQIWMAENLNYAALGSKCGNSSNLSDANTSDCDTYGRLYNWATAMAYSLDSATNPGPVRGVCPNGWHIPRDTEWTALVNFIGSSTAGTQLKTASGWNPFSGVPAGSDIYGFSALPGGNGYSNDFQNAGSTGYWWSTTATEVGVLDRVMSNNREDITSSAVNKTFLFSVRCVKD